MIVVWFKVSSFGWSKDGTVVDNPKRRDFKLRLNFHFHHLHFVPTKKMTQMTTYTFYDEEYMYNLKLTN